MATDDEATTAESLLRDADTAMYQAKEAGRDAVAIFDVEMRDRTARRARLERDLHTALEHDELVLHYQPVVDLEPVDVGRVRGAAAVEPSRTSARCRRSTSSRSPRTRA